MPEPRFILGEPVPRPDYPGAWDVKRAVYGPGLPSWACIYRTPEGWSAWAGGQRYPTPEDAAAALVADRQAQGAP